jgi:tetratricopeptide (TPR) repeat protein
VTGAINQPPEPLWKGLFSFQVAAAVAGSVFFWLTIQTPDRLPATNKLPPAGDATLFQPAVLEDVEKSEPMKLLKQGKSQEALTAASQLMTQKPYDVRALMIAGDVIATAGDKGQGITLLRKSTYLCAESRYVRLNYARYLAKTDRLEEATSQYEQLCSKYPSDWTTPRVELADIYLKLNSLDKAKDKLKEVVNADTKNGAARKLLGITMANEGKEGFEEFLKGCALEQLQGMPPDLKAYVKSGSLQKAEGSLKSEVAAKPEEVQPLLLLGELYLTTNRVQDAKSLILPQVQHRQSINEEPNVHFLLSEILDKTGDHDGAYMEFKGGAKLLYKGE